MPPQFSTALRDNWLFAVTVRGSFGYGGPSASLVEIEAAARLANAHEFICALPQGYETLVGERGVTLSQGQRQRIAIARAAIRKAPILILDEPMTGLDKKNEKSVLESLQRLQRDRTTFLITHDLRHATWADLIVFMEAGQVLERGTRAELIKANGLYAAMYRLQAATHREAQEEPLVPGQPVLATVESR